MITSVQFSQPSGFGGQNKLAIAQPSKDSGAMTVICGKNHSGKSYILKRVHRTIIERNRLLEKNPVVPVERLETDDIYCTFAPSLTPIASPILITRMANITDFIKGTSVIKDTSHKRHHIMRSDHHDRVLIKEGIESLRTEFISQYTSQNNLPFDLDSWNDPEKSEYRLEIMKRFPDDELHKAPQANELVNLFEKLTQGRLYLGVSTSSNNLPIFEFHLAFSGNIIIPSGGWSEGQKVLLTVLLIVYYKVPTVLLLDEIENHLHPEYISAVLKFIKKRVDQTIITTHHPHIIFSRFIDLVNYLDIDKSSVQLPDVIKNDKNYRSRTPARVNQTLEKNYAKLLSTYNLFDSYDNQLLRLSTSNIANLNEMLTETFTSLYHYDIIPPDKSKNPDLQSQKLYEIFRSKLLEGPINVLEFGAGDGRLLIDINKVLLAQEKDRIKWSLYEPFEKPRKKIESILADYPYADLVTVYDERPATKFDFIVIANVLHELRPDIIADIIYYSYNALSEDGSIIIVELYPLLKPEKFAVPLSCREWASLGRALGFNVFSQNIPFKNASNEAYFTQLSKKRSPISDVETLKRAIITFWNEEVLPARAGDYAGRLRMGDSDEIPKTIGDLSTIASINAYGFGYWD